MKIFAVVHPQLDCSDPAGTGSLHLFVRCEAWQITGSGTGIISLITDPSPASAGRNFSRVYQLTEADSPDTIRAKFIADIQAIFPLAAVVWPADSIGTL